MDWTWPRSSSAGCASCGPAPTTCTPHLAAARVSSPATPGSWRSSGPTSPISGFTTYGTYHASCQANLGATSTEPKESLGHKTLAMVARYAYLARAHKGEVAARPVAELDKRQKG